MESIVTVFNLSFKKKEIYFPTHLNLEQIFSQNTFVKNYDSSCITPQLKTNLFNVCLEVMIKPVKESFYVF